MKKRVYVETTIISLLASRPSRDLMQLAHQQATRDWWDKRSASFDLFVSQLVLDEVRGGDKDAASRGLAVTDGLPVLRVSNGVGALAKALIAGGTIPRKASDDAMHLALASVYAMNYLLTWNCRHLANVEIMERAEAVVIAHGFRPPCVCTPDQLMGEMGEEL